jgi:hypothetical protein
MLTNGPLNAWEQTSLADRIEMKAATRYSHTVSRSKPVLLGFSLVIVAESLALHAFLYRRSVWASIAVLAANAATIWWLVRDYQAIGAICSELTDEQLILRVGNRATCVLPLSNIAAAVEPSWRQMPPDMAKGYLKLSGFDDPNILVTTREPAVVRLGLGISRRATTLGIGFDAPEAFAADIAARIVRLEGRGSAAAQ